eukprot:UN25602
MKTLLVVDGLYLIIMFSYLNFTTNQCFTRNKSENPITVDFWFIVTCFINAFAFYYYLQIKPKIYSKSRAIKIFDITYYVFSVAWYSYGWYLWVYNDKCHSTFFGYVIFSYLLCFTAVKAIDLLLLIASSQCEFVGDHDFGGTTTAMNNKLHKKQ